MWGFSATLVRHPSFSNLRTSVLTNNGSSRADMLFLSKLVGGVSLKGSSYPSLMVFITNWFGFISRSQKTLYSDLCGLPGTFKFVDNFLPT